MIYNAGWDNLIPQERKYTPALAASAAKMLESGDSLTTTARAHNVSRASLRNWSTTDPTLKKAFYTFEANKLKAEEERERVRHFKAVAKDIVDNARNGVADPVAQAVEKPTDQPTPREETVEQTRERSLQRWLESDWTPHFEAQLELMKRMKEMRYVGTKTFYPLEGQIWCDSGYDPKVVARKTNASIHLRVNTPQYFDLINRHPQVAKYLALGNVVFEYKGIWYWAR